MSDERWPEYPGYGKICASDARFSRRRAAKDTLCTG